MSCFFYFLEFDLHGSTVKRKNKKIHKNNQGFVQLGNSV